MKFRVRVLRRAVQDVREIAKWIAERSRPGAESWLKAWERLLDRLAESADSFAIAEENDEFELEIRQGLFKTRRGRIYRAVFTIVDNEVRVLRVRGPGQAPLTPDDVQT